MIKKKETFIVKRYTVYSVGGAVRMSMCEKCSEN